MKKSPILPPWSQEAGQQAGRRPVLMSSNVEENRPRRTFQSLGKTALCHVLDGYYRPLQPVAGGHH